MTVINGTELGNDNISSGGSPSGDTLFSSTYGGNDTVSIFSPHYEVYLGEGDDLMQGGIGGVGYGEAGNDRIVSFLWEGTHSLYGGDGDDRFQASYGGNSAVYSAYGGAGMDQFEDFSRAPTPAVFDGGSGFDIVIHSGTTAIALTLGATGNQGGATKTYIGIEGVVGGLGHDTMTGTTAGNLMVGGNGADVINGGGGADFLIGEGRNGNFIRAYMGLNFNFSAADAFDPLNANVAGSYSEDDAKNDSLYGGAGNDVLAGGDGADLLDGGTGTDWASYLASPQHLSLALNLVTGGTLGAAAGDVFVGIENVQGSSGTDTIIGNSGANELRGMNNQDSLSGQSGNDTLIGGQGRDTLSGDRGNDVMTGGEVEDVFVFAGIGALDSIDTITDMTVNFDEIRLSAAVFRKVGPVGALAADAFVIGSAAADAEDRIIYDSVTGALYYDANGTRNGGIVQFAQLSAGLALTEGDFAVIA